jgi:phage tail-like protein
MSQRLSKWVSPLAIVIVTVAVVVAANSWHNTSSGSPRPASAPAAAVSTVVTTKSFVLAVPTFGTFTFSQLSAINSEVEPIPYVSADGTDVIHTTIFGKTKPASVQLKMPLAPNTGVKRLFAWHRLVTNEDPNASVDAILSVVDSTGKTTMSWTLRKAWVSQLTTSGLAAGATQSAQLTVKIVCDQIVQR